MDRRWLGCWLAGWLVGANERTRPLVKVPFTLMTKNRTSTQWNGRMVMETAFNLHRRSLFVDSLRVGVLVSALSHLLLLLPPSTLPPPLPLMSSISLPSLAMKRALSFIYHQFDRIFYSDYASPVQNGESLYDCPSLPIVMPRGPTTRLML